MRISKLYPHVDIEIWFARKSRWTLATLKRPILDCVWQHKIKEIRRLLNKSFRKAPKASFRGESVFTLGDIFWSVKTHSRRKLKLFPSLKRAQKYPSTFQRELLRRNFFRKRSQLKQGQHETFFLW